MPVSLKLLHSLDFRPHAGQVVLVRDGHSLKHGDLMLVVFSRNPGDIDVRKATFGEIFFDDNPLAADLDLCSGEESAWRSIGSLCWCPVSSSSVRDGGGGICHCRRRLKQGGIRRGLSLHGIEQ
jgi:hypothetical protein